MLKNKSLSLLIGIVLGVILFSGTVAYAQQGYWILRTNKLQPIYSGYGLRVPALTNCDTIDTDASGNFSCGTDASGAGSLFSTSTGFTYLTDTTSDLVIGASATSSAPFWMDVSSGDLTITGDMTAINFYGDGSNMTNVGAAAASALTYTGKAAENISKGQPVYISGAVGGNKQFSLSDNTVDTKTDVVGLAASTQTSGQTILIRRGGDLLNWDTSAWSAGDHLYLSANGTLSTTTPTSGVILHVGDVEYSHASQGDVSVQVYRKENRGAASTSDMFTRLGDDAGTNQLEFRNYSNTEVAYINSLGAADFASLTLDTDLDISGDTNLAGTANEIVLTDDTLSIHADIARDAELHDSVTVSGTPNYITLSGQDIVRGIVDIGDDTNATTSGVLMDLTGDTFSVNEGTMTTGKICIYTSGTGIVCNTTDDDVPEAGDFGALTGGTGIGHAVTGTLTFDATELGALTWGAGSDASVTHTYSLSGATDPQWTVGNNSMDLTVGALKVGGTAVLTGNETITLSGDIIGSGATAITTVIATSSVADNEIDYSAVTLTDFDYQTAWRVFYSDGSGDVTELALGSNGQYLKSAGAAAAPIWDTPTGAGDVEAVGDCAGGLCFDGSSDGGTYLKFYDAQGAGQLITGDLSTTTVWTLPAVSGTLIYSGGAFHDGFSDYVANEHIDWTADKGATNIHTGNYPITDSEVPDNITIDLATLASTITVADESAATTTYVGYFTAASGSLAAKTGTNLTFNSATGILTATGFAGDITGALTGNADTCTTASAGDAAVDFFGAGVDAVTDATTCTNIEGTGLSITTGTLNWASTGLTWAGNAIADEYIPNNVTIDLATLATTLTITDNESTAENNAILFTAGGALTGGNLGIESDGDLHYNPSTGLLTATGFAGALTGNASTATTLANARTIGGVSFNGSANIVPTTIAVTDTTDTTSFIGIWESATGDLLPKTDGGLTYNAGTGMLTATGFTGPLTGEAATVATIDGLAPNTATTQATQGNITSLGTLTGLTMGGDIAMGGNNIDNGGVIFLTEQADADADVAGKGQIWVNTATPNELWWTDDAGTDTQLGLAGATPTTITVADESVDETSFIGFFTAATGDLGPKTASGLTFNAATDILTATGFSGPLTGNVTGNADTVTGYTPASGSITLVGADALTITTTAATGITLPTSGTLYGTAADTISSANLLSSLSDETGSGLAVFGTAPSVNFDGGVLEMPQDDTTDAVGEMQLDTTDTTFIIHDGTANRVFGDDIYQTTFTVYADADWTDDEVPIWIAPKDMAITIVQVDAASMGTTTPILTYNIEERAWGSLASAGTDIFASDFTADADGNSTTTLSNAGIAAKAHLVLTPSAESGTVDLITGVIYYRKNVE